MGIFTDSIKIKWNHFGYKLSISLSKKNIESTSSIDLFEKLMKKVYAECPKFNGIIAYYDQNNCQKFITCDLELRKFINEMKDAANGKLKVHTTLPERSSLPLAEKISTRFHRSYSVPPIPQSPTSSKSVSNKPSISSEAAAAAKPKPSTASEHRPSIQNSLHSRLDRKNSSNYLQNHRNSIRSGSSSNGSRSSSIVYPSTAHYPLGYHHSYSSYNNAPCPPGPSFHHYGVPPMNMLLGHLLTGGHYHPMHPAFGPMGHNRFMGGFAW